MTLSAVLAILGLVLSLLLSLLALDRVLLWAERRGCIYYRVNRPARGASMYHLNELSQMLTGSGIPEIHEEVQEEESGDPPSEGGVPDSRGGPSAADKPHR
jgi:hypothetical protein